MFKCISCLKNLIFGRKYSKHNEKQENVAQNNREDKKIDSSTIVVNDPPKTKENVDQNNGEDKKVNNIKDSKWEIIDKTKKIEI